MAITGQPTATEPLHPTGHQHLTEQETKLQHVHLHPTGQEIKLLTDNHLQHQTGNLPTDHPTILPHQRGQAHPMEEEAVPGVEAIVAVVVAGSEAAVAEEEDVNKTKKHSG